MLQWTAWSAATSPYPALFLFAGHSSDTATIECGRRFPLVQQFSTSAPWHTGMPWMVHRYAMGIWVGVSFIHRELEVWAPFQEHGVLCQMSKNWWCALAILTVCQCAMRWKKSENHCSSVKEAHWDCQATVRYKSNWASIKSIFKSTILTWS